jgi:hypothetical protein
VFGYILVSQSGEEPKIYSLPATSQRVKKPVDFAEEANFIAYHDFLVNSWWM